ncbi:MAG TPA: SIS domain-containing protein [Elusimicrobiales bacterium]|nr:SIS domain-containing protein [Elusimicrobiales bacterium]
MKNFADAFLESIWAGIKTARCTAGGGDVPLGEGVAAFHDEVVKCAAAGGKVLYVGNGGSASIAGHMSADLWKNGGIKTMCFSEPSLLTCLANDLGYENVFSAPTQSYADKGDVFVAISSSGRSPNIIKAAEAALKRGCTLVTFSGFSPDNPLRRLGKLNFYVDSSVYGVVESAHSALCHAVVDSIIRERGTAA